MALNLNGYFTLPFQPSPLTMEVDFNKPSKQSPRAINLTVNWELADAKLGQVFQFTTDPYAIQFDIFNKVAVPIFEVKAAIIDNTNNAYPVLLECTDTGFQVRVEPGEYRQAVLITSSKDFKLWSLYGSGGTPTPGARRRTDLYFLNISLPSFSAVAPKLNLPFVSNSGAVPLNASIDYIRAKLTDDFNLPAFLRRVRIDTLGVDVSSGFTYTISLRAERGGTATAQGTVLARYVGITRTHYTGPYFSENVFNADNLDYPIPAGAALWLMFVWASGSGNVGYSVNGGYSR